MDTSRKKICSKYGTVLKDLRRAVRMDPIILEGSSGRIIVPTLCNSCSCDTRLTREKLQNVFLA